MNWTNLDVVFLTVNPQPVVKAVPPKPLPIPTVRFRTLRPFFHGSRWHDLGEIGSMDSGSFVRYAARGSVEGLPHEIEAVKVEATPVKAQAGKKDKTLARSKKNQWGGLVD